MEDLAGWGKQEQPGGEALTQSKGLVEAGISSKTPLRSTFEDVRVAANRRQLLQSTPLQTSPPTGSAISPSTAQGPNFLNPKVDAGRANK